MKTIASKPPRLLAALTLIIVLSVALAAGCGNDATPADAAPELAEQLARVDRAVSTGNEARIRVRVESLVTATKAAREAGELDNDQAARILAAADALLARLPASPAPTSPTTSPSTISPSPHPEDEDEDEKDEKHEPKPKPEPKPPKPKHDEGKHDKGPGHKH